MEIEETYIDNVYADYIRCAFDDPEFLKNLGEIEAKIDGFRTKYPELNYLGVFNSPLLRSWGSTDAPKEIVEDDLERISALIMDLASEYQIPPETIDMYTYGSIQDPSAKTKKYNYLFNNKSGKYIIEIQPKINQKEFAAIWNDIFKKKKNRNSSPFKSPKLLYAIHRSDQKGLTYREISKHLDSKTLPGFEGNSYPTTGEDNIKSLHARFRKHLEK